MVIAHQFAFRRKILHGALLQDGIVVLKIVKDFRLQHHKASVNHRAVLFFLLPERTNLPFGIHIQNSLLLSKVYHADGCRLAMLFMEVQKSLQIHIGNSVSISQHKRLML